MQMSDIVLPWLSRFINSKAKVKRYGRVPFTVFKAIATSVYMHEKPRIDIRWQAGRDMNPGKKLIGAADISVAEVERIGLVAIKSTSVIDSEFHVELLGGDSFADKRSATNTNSVATDLADSAVFVSAPEMEGETTNKVPKVTFVIIQFSDVCNSSLWDKTCKSLQMLSDKAWECVCINDGRDQMFSRIVTKYQAEESDRKEKMYRFRYFEHDAVGYDKSKDRVMGLASTEIMIALNSGDIVTDTDIKLFKPGWSVLSALRKEYNTHGDFAHDDLSVQSCGQYG